MRFVIRSENRDTIGLLEICGEVDILTSPELKEGFQKLFEQNQFRVVVNLLEARYFDASGLGVLAVALKRCREAGGNIVVVCTTPHILKVFSITGMDKAFEIFETQEEAIGFLNNLGQSE